MYRKGSTHRKNSESGNQIIDKATYNKITKPAVKQGADIAVTEKQLESYKKEMEELKKRGEWID